MISSNNINKDVQENFKTVLTSPILDSEEIFCLFFIRTDRKFLRNPNLNEITPIPPQPFKCASIIHILYIVYVDYCNAVCAGPD
jgi:hypothetical protein